MNKDKAPIRFSHASLVIDLELKTDQSLRMYQWTKFRLKKLLFLLEVVYSDIADLKGEASHAIHQITELLTQLEQGLQQAIHELPTQRRKNQSLRYSGRRKLAIYCSTPQSRLFIEAIQHYDQLIQQCDLLWLTRQWNRSTSREPIHTWAKTIAQTVQQCCELFEPVHREYLQLKHERKTTSTHLTEIKPTLS